MEKRAADRPPGGGGKPARERSLRLFVALPAPARVRAAAGAVIERLREHGDVRWVTPERLHLTLKFLGATPPEMVETFAVLLAQKANTFSPFVLESRGIGAFPSTRRPQTLWMGVADGSGTLLRLAAAVEDAACGAGFPRDQRAYCPHLTLGRLRSPLGQDALVRALEREVAASDPPTEWAVEELQLIRSTLRPAGPEYALVRRFPLLGKPHRGESHLETDTEAAG